MKFMDCHPQPQSNERKFGSCITTESLISETSKLTSWVKQGEIFVSSKPMTVALTVYFPYINRMIKANSFLFEGLLFEYPLSNPPFPKCPLPVPHATNTKPSPLLMGNTISPPSARLPHARANHLLLKGVFWLILKLKTGRGSGMSNFFTHHTSRSYHNSSPFL